MSRVKQPELLNLHWQQRLNDYVTAIVWFAGGSRLVASSAAGEVVCYSTDAKATEAQVLQAKTGTSIDCVAISTDGQFVAAGGQNGEVKIWRVNSSETNPFELVATLENAPAWVDRMAWNPQRNQLAFSLGRYVQVWDADAAEVITTLNFEASSVLDVNWRPDGEQLSVAGYQGIKVWSTADWDDDPQLVTVPSASTIVLWSPDGNYIAFGNIDRTISVIEWENSHVPWVMRGFPGKIRQLAWSSGSLKRNAPLMASSSADSIVIWERHEDDTIGWEGHVLGQHDDRLEALQFQPGTGVLASAGADGWVVLWQKQRIVQTLEGAPDGFSTLCWHPKGNLLAAGGKSGELLVWAKAMRGQGFGVKR